MIQIGTWNVEYARPSRLDALQEVLDQHHADIWVLTETHDDLAPSGAGYYAHSRPRPRDAPLVRDGSRWVSIWSRYPIVPTPQFELLDPERTVVAVIQARPDKQILIYGTVIPWKGDRGKMDWSEHHRVISEQCEEWRDLKRLYPDADLCVAGDYNTDMGTGRLYGTKVGITALRSGLAKCNLFCATEPSLMPSAMLLQLPVDHIALPAKYQKCTRIVAAWDADKRRLSDHSGLVVEVDGL